MGKTPLPVAPLLEVRPSILELSRVDLPGEDPSVSLGRRPALVCNNLTHSLADSDFHGHRPTVWMN